jgi:hypothetical protein
MVSRMRHSVLAAALLASTPALSAGLASSSADESSSSLEGLYAGIAGGGGWLIVPSDNILAWDVELRVGYSFGTPLQIYLSGAVDGGSRSGVTFRTEQLVAFLQYHLIVRPAAMVYARAGIGVGLSGDVVPDRTAVGLAAAGGVGIEFRFLPNLFLAPELYYRNTDLSASGTSMRVQTVGLQLGLIYY